MSSAVDEGKVAMLREFVCYQLSHDDAARLLRISSYDAEQAVMKFYDAGGPEGVKNLLDQSNVGWDSTAFAADRYGHDDGTGSLPTFNIEYAPGVDNYPHSGGPSQAPTRPPSRTSQRSGVSAQAGDAPLQSIEGGQESGVIGNSGPIFGPATKEYYDTANWALVTTTASTEYVPDAPLFYRSRDPGTPAFIKPLPNEHYLPALLTILHSIPMFRNALLAPGISNGDYWLGDDWWKGSASEPIHIVNNSTEAGVAPELDIIYETQRLMASLDGTERAYVSLGHLLQLDAWRETQVSSDNPNDDLLRFLLKWSWALQKQTPDAELNGVLRSTINAGGQRQESFLLDTPVVQHDRSVDLSLYDVLDQALLTTEGGSAHIVDISNVLILRLTSSNIDASSLGCTIPATLYADRYLEKNKPVVDKMLLEMKELEGQVKDMDAKAKKLKYHTPKKANSLPMDTLELLKTGMKAFEIDPDALIEDPRNTAILAQLQSVYTSVERKLAALEEQTNKAREALERVSSRFRAPMEGSTDGQVSQNGVQQHAFAHPYKLWGVSTSPGVLYVLHPDASTPHPKQWWRLEYLVTADEANILREPITLDQVLEKASSESGKALLVYANDAATSDEPAPLAPPLQDFVKKDNTTFQQELSENWEGRNEHEGSKSMGDWDKDPPIYDDWNTMSAKDYHGHAGSGVSSTTLTPDTEVGDDDLSNEMQGVQGMQEMQEVNGGMSAWAGMSNASSDTVQVKSEPMDTGDNQRSQGTAGLRDIEMDDAEAAQAREAAKVEHIEVLERKGG